MFKDAAFIWYLTWGAVPAILSIILFWFTNSKATVSTRKSTEIDTKAEGGVSTTLSRLTSNPLSNLAINITGAAALFFILFIIMNPIKTGFFEKETNWKLKIAFKNQEGKDIPYEKLISIEPIPAIRYDPFDEKTILVSLDDLREEKAKLKINYSLRVRFDGYETYTIPLSDSINDRFFCTKKTDIKCLNIKPIFLTARLPDEGETSQANVVKINEIPIIQEFIQRD